MPDRDLLRRFFRERRPLTVAEAARLLGWTKAEVLQRAGEDDALVPGARVQWGSVAWWMLERWPRRRVMEAGGTDALPVGLRLIPVLWYAPFYLVHGLNVQRQIEPPGHRDLSEYLIDVLHRAIDPNTVALLQHDRDFMEAFEFPGE